ncbi:class A beta-lactamase-related serine hydrolase [Bifidobacterium jacchi]|uniref:class A beta-lactamase-related serine hydrolase n=1 Tax=Bifidobacterium jacchi TaxID=2490545 RepID=UPI001F4F3434
MANKTGELAVVQNDVAIVYDARPYAVSVMVNGVDESAASNIATLSARVYQTFEK